MFSNRFRLLKIAGISGLIAVLGLWAHRSIRDPAWVDYLARPGEHHDRTIVVAREAKVVSADSSRLVATQPEGEIELRVPSGFELPPLRPGQDIVAVAVFHRDGFFTLEAIESSPLRRWKIIISLLVAAAVVVYLLFSVRVEKGGLALKE